MKKFLKILMWVFIILIAVVLIGAAFMPSKTSLESSVMIKAKPEKIFPYINCLKKTTEWSPWEGISNQSYNGPECGTGAVQEWKDESGSGKQTIMDSKENEYVKTDLDFMEQGTAKAELKLEASGESTKVTWSFESEAKYPLGRWIGVLFVKPMLKDSYEKGLNKLDSLIISLPDQPVNDGSSPAIEEVAAKNYLYINMKSNTEELGAKMGEGFGTIMAYMKQNNIEYAGAPIIVWKNWHSGDLDFDCAVETKNEEKGNGDIKPMKSFEGKVVSIMHSGAYDKSYINWKKVENYIEKNDMEVDGYPWEEYLTDPTVEKDTTKWLTKLYMPVK